MEINKVLVWGRLADAFESSLPRTDSKEYRFVTSDDLTQQSIDWADAFVSFSPPRGVDLSGLKWVHSLGAGVNGFVLNPTLSGETLLTRTIASFGEKIGVYCLSYILRNTEHHDDFAALQADKRWNPLVPKRLKDITVLIFGAGEIGTRSAQILSSLGMDVVGISRSGEGRPGFSAVYSSRQLREIDTVPRLRETCQNADFVIVTLPLTRDTTGMIDAQVFSLFADAVLINVGRGDVLVETDMLRALEAGHLSQCILDVFPLEPLESTSPLWSHEKIIVTPHIAAITYPEEAVQCFVDTLQRIEHGLTLVNRVDTTRGY